MEVFKQRFTKKRSYTSLTRAIRSLVGLGLRGLGLGLGEPLGASWGNPGGPRAPPSIKTLYKNPLFHYVHSSGKTQLKEKQNKEVNFEKHI